MRHDPEVSPVQVGQLVLALQQAGLSDVTTQPVVRDSGLTSMPDLTVRTAVEEQGLAVLQALADLGRQLPTAMNSLAKSLQDKYQRFSERTAAYLASGRPALVQDTGFSAWLEPGAGLLTFSLGAYAVLGDLEIAVAAGVLVTLILGLYLVLFYFRSRREAQFVQGEA